MRESYKNIFLCLFLSSLNSKTVEMIVQWCQQSLHNFQTKWFSCKVESLISLKRQTRQTCAVLVKLRQKTHVKMSNFGGTNNVFYGQGYAPIGELRDWRGSIGESRQEFQNLPAPRYGRRRPFSNIAKLIHMRKCKRWYFENQAP